MHHELRRRARALIVRHDDDIGQVLFVAAGHVGVECAERLGAAAYFPLIHMMLKIGRNQRLHSGGISRIERIVIGGNRGQSLSAGHGITPELGGRNVR